LGKSLAVTASSITANINSNQQAATTGFKQKKRGIKIKTAITTVTVTIYKLVNELESYLLSPNLTHPVKFNIN